MKTVREEGVALLLALVMVLIVALLSASLMFSAQSATWSSMNYRLMTQAKYGAEAAINVAVNYLLNAYTPPGDAGDPIAAYTMTVSPVTYNTNPVVLSSEPTVASNYPIAADITAFANAAKGSFTGGNSVISYTATAKLVAMRQVVPYGSTTAQAVQTWLITGYGSINGARNAQIQVETLLERQVVSTGSYAAFATAAVCGAMSVTGNGKTDSYDSSTYTGGTPVTTASGGNVGTNGNLTESGNATINGTLSTPRSGVGNCTTTGMTAETLSGNATVTGGLLTLSQTVTYPTPALPNPLPSTSSYHPPTNWAPGTYGNVNLSGNSSIHLTAGVYNINSISMSGNSQLIIDSGPVIFNVVGAGTTQPIDLSGNGVINSTMNPAQFQVLYAGTSSIGMTGNAQQAALLYAPNASLTLTGNGDFYGTVIAGTVTYTGNGTIHYDRHLASAFTSVGNPMIGTFSWKKF